jgi:glucose-1-phosphate adenylyltransferase
MSDVLSLILGGGKGTRLYPLTKHRSKPAVPIAGKYRLIDIPVSNCINSGFNRVYVLTQFLSVSLHRHIANTYKFDPFGRGFVEILAAQQTNEAADWYQGTADAVRQNIRYLHGDLAEHVLILSGDQVYRMDFRDLLRTHQESAADVTIAVLPVPREQVSGFGIVRLDDTGRVRGFLEKPKEDRQLATVRTPEEWLKRQGVAGEGRNYLANMGIYLFNRAALLGIFRGHPEAVDFGKEIFPRALETHRVLAHLYQGYWEDLGTIRSYHEANLALASNFPPFDFHDPAGVIYTRMRYLPASRTSDVRLKECLVSDGCVVDAGTSAERCVFGVRSRVGENVTLRDTILIGADRFETEAERFADLRSGTPPFGVGAGSVIERAILDKDCRIGRNVRIVNARGVQEADTDRYVIRDGIVVIPRGTVVPDGTMI